MDVIAHIGNIPVEEWLPFLVPVVVLYLYVRRKERRRREAVKRLPDAGEALDAGAIRTVLGKWSAADHKELSREHLPLLYPPGPDGTTALELASRINCDPSQVRRLLDDLADLGYIELDEEMGVGVPRVALTAEGFDLVNLTEDAVLAAFAEADAGAAPSTGENEKQTGRSTAQ